MSGPRNKPEFFAGQAVRNAVRDIMATHSPLAWPLTAKQINARLPPHLRRSEADIRWHVRAIRYEAEIELATLTPRECIE